MLIWRELEELAEVSQAQAEGVSLSDYDLYELREEIDSQRLPLRRRLAAAASKRTS